MLFNRLILTFFLIFLIKNESFYLAKECNSDPDTEMCSLEPTTTGTSENHEKSKYSKGILNLLFIIMNITITKINFL